MSLLSLPVEVRLLIYEHLLSPQLLLICLSDEQPKWPAMCLVSAGLREEILPLLMREAGLTIHVDSGGARQTYRARTLGCLNTLTPAAFAAINYVYFDCLWCADRPGRGNGEVQMDLVLARDATDRSTPRWAVKAFPELIWLSLQEPPIEAPFEFRSLALLEAALLDAMRGEAALSKARICQIITAIELVDATVRMCFQQEMNKATPPAAEKELMYERLEADLRAIFAGTRDGLLL